MLNRHSTNNDGYVTKLQLRHARMIRTNGDRTIKHVVDQNLEKKLSRPFYFVQDPKGKVTDVFYPHDDSPDLVGIKKGNSNRVQKSVSIPKSNDWRSCINCLCYGAKISPKNTRTQIVCIREVYLQTDCNFAI